MALMVIDIFFVESDDGFASSIGNAITHYKSKGATYMAISVKLKETKKKSPQLVNAFKNANESFNGAADKLKIRINSHGDAKRGVFAVGETEKTPEQIVEFLQLNGLENSATRGITFTLFACETAFQFHPTSPCIAQRFRDHLTNKGILNCVVKGSPFLLEGDEFPMISPLSFGAASHWDTVNAYRRNVLYHGKMAF